VIILYSNVGVCSVHAHVSVVWKMDCLVKPLINLEQNAIHSHSRKDGTVCDVPEEGNDSHFLQVLFGIVSQVPCTRRS
jgi:hypothetical protein